MRRLKWLAFVPALVLCSPLLAQDDGEEEPQASWVLSYALVILCVGLGMAPICRPSRRGKEVKRR